MGFLRDDTPKSHNFIRGPVRVLAMRAEMYELVEVLDDIIVLSEEPWLFDVRPGVVEVGYSKTGISLEDQLEEKFDFSLSYGEIIASNWSRNVRIELIESSHSKVMKVFEDDENTVLIGMMQKPDQKIRAVIFEEAKLMRFETMIGFGNRGEQVAIPCQWHYNSATIIDQLEVPKAELFHE